MQSKGIFVDGVLADMLGWAYPRPERSAQGASFIIGDSSAHTSLSWCIASVYLLSIPLGRSLCIVNTDETLLFTLGDDIVRLVQHFGARYMGNFQDLSLKKFITYDASTSLNMFLTSVSKLGQPGAATSIVKALSEGLNLAEKDIIFSLSPTNLSCSGSHSSVRCNNSSAEFIMSGDIYVVKSTCMDESLWKIGGAAVPLRLIQVANVRSTTEEARCPNTFHRHHTSFPEPSTS
jgi:hypothetical protein